jgi:hypothetical protein
MPTEASENVLDRVRKLLAKAEDEGVTPHEAEALTAKASELMARYGIDRARLGALHPESDNPGDRVFDLDNPWAAVKCHLLSGLSQAMRCQTVIVPKREQGSRLHVFGYASDIERADILFTSLLVQMQRALAREQAPEARVRAWRRSWMLGFSSAVIARVRTAEEHAVKAADADQPADGGKSTALVLADRSQVIRAQVKQTYPSLRTTRTTYTGSGYESGHREGQRADIGGAKIGRSRPALPR